MLEFLTFLVILVALFGREFVDWVQRPHLELDFDIDDESFFHEIPFPLDSKQNDSPIYSRGFNCLLKVSNPQVRRLFFIKTQTAKRVEVKITYIFQADWKHTYHPTNLNWSGGRGKTSVSIIPGSHYFLDFISFHNLEDLNFEDEKIKKLADIASLISPPLPEEPEERVYFEPWFYKYYGGIRKRFTDDGTYRIHFVINGENCGPYKYVATLKWSKSKWDEPDIKIEKGG